MSKCLRCGAELPPRGDCSRCVTIPGGASVPKLLDQQLRLDRRGQAEPPRPLEAVTQVNVPSGPFSHAQPPVEDSGPALISDSAVTLLDDEEGGLKQVRARPAALWRRLGAWLVDLCAIAAVLGAYLWVASALVDLSPPAGQLGAVDAFAQQLRAWQKVLVPGAALAVIVALAYSTLFAFLWQGRTPGRRLFGIRLVDRSGLAPTPTRSVLRAGLAVFSFALFLGGFWLALFDRRGQTLHDKLTATFVIQPS